MCKKSTLQISKILFSSLLIMLSSSALQAQDELKLFELDSLITEVENSGRPWLGFFKNDNLTTGIYTLEAGADDQQSPHKTDEIYYVIEGAAQFECEDKTVTVKPGSILFVPANATHRFLDIKSKLVLLVFFD